MTLVQFVGKSAVFPSYRASKMQIVEGLRYIG